MAVILVGKPLERTVLKKQARAISAAAILLVGALAAAYLAGCGSNEARARQYIESAREKGSKAAEAEAKLQRKGEELARFNEIFQNITPETASTLKKYLAELLVLHEQINKKAEEARSEYDRILDLEGAGDFKKYARNRIRAIDLIDKRSLLLKQFAAIYDHVVDQALEGQAIDEGMVRNQAEQIILERGRVDKELEELNNKAADLAEKLNIE